MSHVQASIAQAAQTMESLRALEEDITRAASLVKECLAAGGKLLVCGNGGSAADASDFTTEYVCRFVDDRQPFPAINLTADGGLLTAIGNDYGFEETFARQVRGFGKTGDVVIVL
jgi:phosphoheptose isomerase